MASSVGAISFSAIGITFGATSVILISSFVLLGVALKLRSIAIAPRCAGRPLDTIHNPYPIESSQDRGNPFWGWILWVLQFDYETMILGIPGTGTSCEGRTGRLLNLNLDAIVMLRFNALCLRLTVFTCIMAIGIILPINVTASPFDGSITFNDTTLANIPILDVPMPSPYDFTHPLTFFTKLGQNLVSDFATQFRLYVIVFCSWILTYLISLELTNEWKDNLSLRRKYYFEANIYRNRRRELRQLLSRSELDIFFDNKREPWIPNPDQRDTIPNVQLYSVLVGNVPSLPPTLVDENDPEAQMEFTEQQKIDWQLAVATAFFDSCVPNQPGFSSSVAAITILPGAMQLAQAWKKWYKAAAALRQLRFIRSLIVEKKYLDVGLRSLAESFEDVNTVTSSVNNRRNIFLGGHSSYEEESQLSQEEKITQFLSYSDVNVEHQLMEALNYGPEQTGAYSKEFALAASGWNPYGVDADKLRNLNINQLTEMERTVFSKVEKANNLLRETHDKLISRCKDEKKNELDIINESTSRSEEDEDDDSGERDSAEKDSAEKDSFLDDEEDDNSDAGSLQLSAYAAPDNVKDDFITKALSFNHLKVEESVHDVINPVLTRRKSYHQFEEDQHKKRNELKKSESLRMLGSWSIQPKPMKSMCEYISRNYMKACLDRINESILELISDPTFAVVTFTNRQAAVSARQCLSDGRGGKYWSILNDIPVPPLADAAPLDICGRGIWRPVTLSISRHQQVLRSWTKNVLLVFINLFYTVPLTFLANLPRNWTVKGHDISAQLSGIIYACLYALFVCACPYMFKAIANFGSNQPSLSLVELSAMKYYWIFMLVTSFSSTVIATSFINAWNEDKLAPSAYYVLQTVADTIPVQISYNWINNIIFDFAITIPVFFLLQFSTIVCKILRLEFFARILMKGGGAGGMMPYRLYIDTGTIFLCAVTLSLVCPIVAPFSVIFFMINELMLRRNLIFVYKPVYDGGGSRWPFLSELCFSSVLLAQFLLTIMIFLKRAVGPALVACSSLFLTVAFRKLIMASYYRAYTDTALLQTAHLDMWDIDSDEPSSKEERESFRKFLVDAHRAAYIPVCIAGSATSILTSEPAIALATSDNDVSYSDMGNNSNMNGFDSTSSVGTNQPRMINQQRGVSTRRVATGQLQNRSKSSLNLAFSAGF